MVAVLADELFFGTAEPEDAPAIAAVRKITWLATYQNEALGITKEDIETKEIDSPSRINELKSRLLAMNDLEHVWVAKHKGRVVGFANATKQPKHEITSVYVLPEYQGLKIGKKLMDLALGWLGNKVEIYVDVMSYNGKALDFYKKYGFVDSGQTKVSRFPSGKSMSVNILIRKPE